MLRLSAAASQNSVQAQRSGERSACDRVRPSGWRLKEEPGAASGRESAVEGAEGEDPPAARAGGWALQGGGHRWTFPGAAGLRPRPPGRGARGALRPCPLLRFVTAVRSPHLTPSAGAGGTQGHLTVWIWWCLCKPTQENEYFHENTNGVKFTSSKCDTGSEGMCVVTQER